MTSPGVSSGRAVSWRDTMRWPSQGRQPVAGIVLHGAAVSVAVRGASDTRLAVRSSLVAKLTRTWQLSRIALFGP